MKYRIFLALKDNLLDIFLADKKFLKSCAMFQYGKKVRKNIYQNFFTISIEDITLIYITQSEKYLIHNDFIEVTNNERYSILNILAGFVTSTNLVVEGSDGVGKSTLVANLAQLGILCQDRAVKEITKMMKPHIDEQQRVLTVSRYLEDNSNCKVVFLYMSNESELYKRIYSRKIISEYDKNTIIFQRLYVDTYLKLSQIYNNIYLVDCFGKTQADMVNDVLRVIKEN